MYVYIYIYIHTHTHTRIPRPAIYVYIYIYIHTRNTILIFIIIIIISITIITIYYLNITYLELLIYQAAASHGQRQGEQPGAGAALGFLEDYRALYYVIVYYSIL